MPDRVPAPAPASAADRLAELGERYFRVQHTYDPYNATLLGIDEFDHLAGDPSAAASAEAAADLAAVADEAAALDEAGLDDAQRTDRDVLRVLARGASDDARHSLWAANASAKGYVSRQGLVFQAVPAMTIEDAAGADRYLSRLDGIAGVLDALGDRYAEETAAGRPSTRMGLAHAVQQLEGYLALPVDDDALLAPTRAGSPAAGAAADRARRTVEASIRPAMSRLASRLGDELIPGARPDDRVGIQHTAGGEAGYLDAVRRHTTTDLDPEEIHRIGLEVLEDMVPRWAEIGGRALGERELPRIAERMRDDPALRFETSQQIIDVAQAALDRAQAARPLLFPPYDIRDCVLEVINPIEAEHSALAYYRPPAVDGSRPGAHCLLATDPATRYRYEYECLAFHESVPGHHLQLATAQTLDIPRYRRHLDVEACSFNEGWGLYSEQLADEMDLYTDDVSRLGMLSFLALRACRLVVDTGIHHLGWTRQQGVDFMWAHTATTRAHVQSEVDRYISWPGQALAYMIGRREILRLREESRAVLGDRFTLPGFHGVVLGDGAVPLSVLERTVTRWRDGLVG
ncbi:uncharacterized protein (DUF885 family) [Clavibacter sp. B3I6]|uniref:DUF885 domain-containing protein n=1 Tax=Clavibacter sp. B3I6 TaxID=3042268 RepID=UPI00278907EC|nr:DUF885 domain-containing protein [Clavibacter sp. B3I6]MDQ0743127.1 uncharacterized protein (DUF885 family) [Clavibacter sp. B3I6]